MQQHESLSESGPTSTPSTTQLNRSRESYFPPSWVLPVLTLLYICMLTATKWPVGTDLFKFIFPVGPAKSVTLADLYLVVLGSFTAALMVRERYNLRKVLNGYILTIAGFISAIAMSAVINGFDVDAIKEILQWIEMGILLVILLYWMRRREHLRSLMTILLLLGTIQAGYQFLSYLAFGLPTVQNKRLFVKFTGFCFLIGLDLLWRDRKGYWIPCLIVLFLTICVSTERKVFVVLPVCVLIYIAVKLYQRFSNPRRIMKWCSLGAGFVLMIGFLVWGTFPVWTEGIYDSLLKKLDLKGRMNARYYLWRTGWDMWMDHFVFGIGPDNFNELKQQYTSNELALRYGIHNMLFGYVLNTGIIGLLWLIALLAQPFRFVLTPSSDWDDDEILMGVLVLYVCGVIFFNAQSSFPRFLLFSTIGLCAAVRFNFQSES